MCSFRTHVLGNPILNPSIKCIYLTAKLPFVRHWQKWLLLVSTAAASSATHLTAPSWIFRKFFSAGNINFSTHTHGVISFGSFTDSALFLFQVNFKTLNTNSTHELRGQLNQLFSNGFRFVCRWDHFVHIILKQLLDSAQ